MKKRWLLASGLLFSAGLFLGGNGVAAASQANSDFGFSVSDGGELEILAARPLNFGAIKYSAKEQVLYPYIENIHQYANAFTSYQLVSPEIVGGPGYYSGYSLVDVSDSRIGGGSWNLSAQLLPAVNSETGESFDLYLQMASLRNIFAEEHIIAVEPLLLSSTDNAPKYVFGGQQGAYPLSIFENVEYFDYYSGEAGTRAVYPGPCTTRDIALVIPANSKISSEGTYKTEIQWTLSDVPKAIPVS